MIARILINKSNIIVLDDIISLVKQRKIRSFSMKKCYNAYNVDYEECEHSDSPELINLLEILENLDFGDKGTRSVYIFYHEENSGIIYNIEKAKVREEEISIDDVDKLSECQIFLKEFADVKNKLKILGIDKISTKQGKRVISISTDVIFDSIELEINKRIK